MRRAGLIGAGNFTRLLVKTIMGFVLARLFTKDDFGTWRQLFLLNDTLSCLVLLGIPQSILFFLPRLRKINPEKAPAFVGQTLWLLGVSGLVLGLGIFLLREPIGHWFSNPALPGLLTLFWLYPFFSFLMSAHNYVFIAHDRPRRTAVFTAVSVITDAVLVLGAALVYKNPWAVTLGLMISSTLQFLYVAMALRPLTAMTIPAWPSIREQLVYSLPLGLASVLGILAKQLDKLVVSGWFTPADYAVFSVGATEIPLVGTIIGTLNAVLLPALSASAAQGNRDDFYRVHRGAVRKNALFIVPLCALFFVVAPDFFVVAFSAPYAGAAVFFRIYIISALLRVAVYNVPFSALGRTRVVLWVSLGSLSTNFLLNLVLVKPFGMSGCAWATVISVYATVTVWLLLSKNMLHLSLRRMYPVSDMLLTALAAGLAGLAIWPITMLSLNPWLRLPLAGAVFVPVFLLTGWLCRAIKPYDWQTGLDLWRRTLSRVGWRHGV